MGRLECQHGRLDAVSDMACAGAMHAWQSLLAPALHHMAHAPSSGLTFELVHVHLCVCALTGAQSGLLQAVA